MSQILEIPILNKIVPTGFLFGGSYAVMSEPDSIWYEISLAITADALTKGVTRVSLISARAPRRQTRSQQAWRGFEKDGKPATLQAG